MSYNFGWVIDFKKYWNSPFFWGVFMLQEEKELSVRLKMQEEQLERIKEAESEFLNDGDEDKLILFWESIWREGGLLFRGSRWAFRLPDLYIKKKRYGDAEKILKKLKNGIYKEKAIGYMEKIKREKEEEMK